MGTRTFCCERCGTIFESTGYVCKYCPTCRVIVKREQGRAWKRVKRCVAPEKPEVRLQCTRCGVVLHDPDALLCDKCRDILAREQNQPKGYHKRTHIVKHIEQPGLESRGKKKKHTANAALSEMSINDILKIAEREHLSYGVTVARLRDGKI